MEEDRLIDSELDNEEVQYNNSLRPSQLAEYVGQEKIKENLNIFIAAAKMREESLDHVLFYGPPGLGKTTLANIIAAEMGANIKSTSGPVIEKTGDLAALLTNLKKGDVLFIDEMHTMVGAGAAEGAVDAWIGSKLAVVEGVRASVDEIEQSGAGWTFAKLTIANATIRDLASAAGKG